MELQNKQSQTVTVTAEEYESLLRVRNQGFKMAANWCKWLDAMWVGMVAMFALGGIAMLIWTRLGGYDMALVLASGVVAILLDFRMRRKHRRPRQTGQ